MGAAALAMTACSSEDNIVSNDLQQNAEVKTYTVSIPATFGDGAQTRAVEFDNSGTPAIDTKFVENEKVYVYNVTDNELLGGYLEAKNVSADGLSCELKGTLTGTNTLVPDDKILLMYNLTDAFTESSSRHMTRFDYGYQQGTAATVIDGATSTMMVKDIDTSDGNKLTFYAEGDGSKTQAKALFANVQSMFRFQFSDGTDIINVKSLKITSKKNALVQAYYPLHGNSMGLYGYGALTVNLTSATTDYIYLGLCFDPSKTAGDVLEFQVTDDQGAVYSGSKAAPAAGFSPVKYYYSTTATVLTKHVPPTITYTASGDAVTNINTLTAGFDITMTNPTGVPNCIGSYYNLGAGGTLRLNGLTATLNDPLPFFNIASDYDDLTLDITGTNTITCEQTTYCLSTNSGNLKLSGNGTLTVRSITEYGLHGANYAYKGGAGGFDVDQLPASGYTVTRSTPADNGDGTYTCTYTVEPNPLLAGQFTINGSGHKVRFSKGNLQATYNGSAWSWAFATNQWDYIGCAEGNTKVTATTPFVSGYTGTSTTVDLFGWVGASSTWTDVNQYGISSSNNGYGNNASESLKSDWGTLAITNGGNTANSGWRTLTKDEWVYLFNTRTTGGNVGTTSQARYAHATINTDGTGVNGMILFPDGVDFDSSEFTTLGTVNGNSDYATKCNTAQWTALAAKGCVFLPAASYRNGTTVYTSASGYYWSSSPYTSDAGKAYYMDFTKNSLYPQSGSDRFQGRSVRLVKDVQ